MPRIQAVEIAPGVFAPLITITIELNGQQVGGFGMIDSGADVTILPPTAIEACGVSYDDLTDPEMGTGAGGRFEYRGCDAVVRYDKWEITKHVAVADPKAGLSWALLGRRDFFTKFVVRFAWHRNPPDFNLDPIK